MLQGFAKDSDVAVWRDEWLEGKNYTAGHDWFFAAPEEGRDGEGGRLTVGIADGVGGKLAHFGSRRARVWADDAIFDVVFLIRMGG